MAYVSILVPAFFVKDTDESEIRKICSSQFETNIDAFELIQLEKGNNIEYAVKFNHSDLSISTIEELIYQRDCIRSLSEKTFESLQLIAGKLNNMEKEMKTFPLKTGEIDNKDSVSIQCSNATMATDNQKLKDLLTIQLENSEHFRTNTEKTLNRIKEEFHNMVQELDTLRKQTSKNKTGKPGDGVVQETVVNPGAGKKNSGAGGSSNEGKGNVPKLRLNK